MNNTPKTSYISDMIITNQFSLFVSFIISFLSLFILFYLFIYLFFVKNTFFFYSSSNKFGPNKWKKNSI